MIHRVVFGGAWERGHELLEALEGATVSAPVEQEDGTRVVEVQGLAREQIVGPLMAFEVPFHIADDEG